jgi:type IX secretion system PorP/SprF family membrane protein
MVRSDKYVIGLSVPRILPSNVTSGPTDIEIYGQHFYFFGGYNFYLKDRVRLRPATLIRATNGAPVSVDLNTNFVIDDKYTVGLLTRNLNTFGALVQAKFKEYRFGYVFELPTNKSVGQNFTSHEITLSVSIPVFPSHEPSFSNF